MCTQAGHTAEAAMQLTESTHAADAHSTDVTIAALAQSISAALVKAGRSSLPTAAPASPPPRSSSPSHRSRRQHHTAPTCSSTALALVPAEGATSRARSPSRGDDGGVPWRPASSAVSARARSSSATATARRGACGACHKSKAAREMLTTKVRGGRLHLFPLHAAVASAVVGLDDRHAFVRMRA